MCIRTTWWRSYGSYAHEHDNEWIGIHILRAYQLLEVIRVNAPPVGSSHRKGRRVAIILSTARARSVVSRRRPLASDTEAERGRSATTGVGEEI